MTKLKGKLKARARAKARTGLFNQITHIANKRAGHKLWTFYWGYKADQLPRYGFEFSTALMTEKAKMPWDKACEIGEIVKESSDYQLKFFLEDRCEDEVGMTRSAFIQEEWERLRWVCGQWGKGFSDMELFTKLAIMGSCAVSTLVAAGEIEQDNWNGDKFGYGYSTK